MRQKSSRQSLRRAFHAATPLVALLALTSGIPDNTALAQGAGIVIGRAIWVVAPQPTLDITAEIAQLCDGKAACEFVIAPATFGGKTPPGNGRHLLIVQYKCGAAGKNGMGHDTETMTLTCP